MRKTPIVYCPAAGKVNYVANADDMTKLAWKKTSFSADSTTNPRFMLPATRV